MPRPPLRALLAGGLLLAVAAPAPAADRPDRLERFHELAASRLSMVQLVEPETPGEEFREIYALLDDEVVENLAAGGPFASLEFLQDRLDAFGEAWGGASLHLTRAGGLLLGAFMLDERAAANSLRVYGTLRGEPALLTALYREGRPALYGSGAERAPLVAVWESAASGGGTRPVRIDVLRLERAGVSVAWSTAEAFPGGLQARSWSVRGPEMRIRYEIRYPGWAPGCADQTEQEDAYRIGTGAVTRVARRSIEPWHRELHATVERLTVALAARDEGAVTALVPDRTLRGRLPAGLRAEPACDARDGAAVSVAAAADDRRPWTLTFRRAAAGWRLTGASPVLQ